MRGFSCYVAVTLLLLVSEWKVSQANGRIGLTLPERVNTILDDPVTLTATFETNRRLLYLSWVKVDPKDALKRVPVFTYHTASGSEAYGYYEGRVELVGKASLKIEPTRMEDEGQYMLNVMIEGLGNEEQVTQLHIMVPPTVEVGPYSPYVTTYRRTVTLTCAVSGAKPNISSLHWEKDGARVETIGFTGKYSGGNMASPSLLIHHVTRADTGSYACIADHVVRPSAASLRLEVLYPASIISVSESLSVDESERATLQCVADGNPTPNITWTKEGTRLRTVTQPLSSDVLACSVVFLSVQVNDSGTYECLATNGVGEADRRIAKLTVRETNVDDRNYIWAIMVGAIAGGLWILVCSGLTLYILKRRRDRREKKKYAFYYNMGKQEDGKDTLGPPTVDLPEYLTKTEETVENLYAKPIKSNYSGIETMRKTAHKKGRRFAKAVYSYNAMEENELHLEVDDVIEVLEGEDGGWCLGYLRGRIGLFPSNYVTFLPAGEASKMTEDLYPNLDSVRSTPCRQSRRKATTPEKTGASREMGQLKKIDCVEI
ncbi:hemicentin-2-like isoform X1 [Branchiostoma floridae]|uniref:Hemicentin-2-like isoform X1 n=2 Tax=Branchiostoma floridae TaxID=7739 RepID=A0A9J7NB52_BRAFL|nr:hemicentin-2-like isoform X1 [Branchiostoma floridae]